MINPVLLTFKDSTKSKLLLGFLTTLDYVDVAEMPATENLIEEPLPPYHEVKMTTRQPTKPLHKQNLLKTKKGVMTRYKS